MNLLNYTSKEMFSSTELIRKSKMIFDKVNKKEIEKAIILRDGKPSFMLLDFNTYEELMNEFIKLKDESSKINKKVLDKKDITNNIKEDEKILEADQDKSTSTQTLGEIKDSDLEDALAQIDNLDIKINDNSEKSMKEFWD